DWVHRYNDGGLEGLSDRRGSGPPARLSPEQRAELVLIVEAGPDLAVDGVVRWRRVDLQRVIRERFGVEMHERTVGKQLAAMGLRRLSVRPHHPKRDPEAQEAFKKTSPTP
ncbi:IS630 family transposase, partial [Jannaschia formosa]